VIEEVVADLTAAASRLDESVERFVTDVRRVFAQVGYLPQTRVGDNVGGVGGH
jgi:hypothetical protein